MIYTNLNSSGEVESVYAAKRATTTGTPPLSYPSKGYDLEDFLITGNTVQNGTPSPDYPVDVQGVGEKTENLFDVNSDKVAGYINDLGDIVKAEYEIWTYDYIDIYGDIDYTYLGYKVIAAVHTSIRVAWYDANKSFISRTFEPSDGENPRTVRAPINARYMRLSIDYGIKDIVFIEGSTPPDHYIPYGYKIPVTIGNVIEPIYIGTVQTTRKIKKLVLTGSESYTYQSQYSRYVFTVQNAFADDIRQTQCFCTHYQSIHNGEPIDDIPDKSIYINYQALGTQFCIKDEELMSIADFKSYLAAQYANGTPITIWYILTATETAIVNEPLHRIGDYADTISLSQSGITVSTIAGTNTITTETTILPSSISVTTPEKEVSEIYAGINYQNPIFYSRKTPVGTSPLTFKGLGQPLKDYHIFGETIQNGTPSPDYPVDVQGVGEYDYVSGKYYVPISGDTTELCDIHDIDRGTLRCGIAAASYYANTSYLVNVSTQTSTPNVILIPVKSATTYQAKFKTNNTALSTNNFVRVAFINEFANGAGAYDIYTWQKDGNSDKLRNDKEYFVTMVNTNYRYLVVQSNLSPFSLFDYFSIQEALSIIDIGSDPLYRVGDYADEIVSDGTLTRRNDIIDILADTSKISYVGWFRKNTPYEYRCFRFNKSPGVRKGTSNYFLTRNTYFDGLNGPGEVTFLYADSYFAINFSVPAHIDTVEKCVQWLTDIYESTGKRPVFVCPISTPTTEQVTVPSLSTIVGDNTLTVDTTVKPSAISITGNIKPTGYGQLLDINDVDIQDKNNESIFIQG